MSTKIENVVWHPSAMKFLPTSESVSCFNTHAIFHQPSTPTLYGFGGGFNSRSDSCRITRLFTISFLR